MDDLGQLKTALRAVVVSSPVNVTLTTLLRDYRNMMGVPLPITKFGYRDPLQFLKERCGDCFLFRGEGGNTVLTPIVPDNLKHIDEFVRKQKVSNNIKFKGKRSSIQERNIQPAVDRRPRAIECVFRSVKEPPAAPVGRQITKSEYKIPKEPLIKETPIRSEIVPKTVCDQNKSKEITPKVVTANANHYNPHSNLNISSDKLSDSHSNGNGSGITSQEAYKNFLRKRLPPLDSTQYSEEDDSSNRDSGKCTSESENHTTSSDGSSKRAALQELKQEVLQLVQQRPEGVLVTQLVKLYREQYGRELNFSRFGFTSVGALACALEGVWSAREPLGDTRLRAGPAPTAPPVSRVPRTTHVHASNASLPTKPDPEDALPWIDFDPDVFPADCVSFSEGIPPPPAVPPGCAMVELMVGEVYSPSHFWFYRLGPHHHLAMEAVMDEMTEYYSRGEGKDRTLAAGAVRAGHYCSSLYEGDWHRALIVSVLDSETVKVRHVDYGTVERVRSGSLKPLLRRWAVLPAQASRGRLAGVCPAAAGRRWPHAACLAFLALLQQRRLVGNIAHHDAEENIYSMYLIDTTSDRDVCLGSELVRAGHADPRAPPRPAIPAGWEFPRFEALETGATPNLADIHEYLRHGIALDFVDEYRRHVPPHDAPLPPTPAPPAPEPSPPPRAPSPPRLDNRIPLLPSRATLCSQSSPSSSSSPSPAPSPSPPPLPTPPPRRSARASLRVPPAPRPLPAAPPRPPPPPPPLHLAPSLPTLPFFMFPPAPPVPPYPMPGYPQFGPAPPRPPYFSPPVPFPPGAYLPGPPAYCMSGPQAAPVAPSPPRPAPPPAAPASPVKPASSSPSTLPPREQSPAPGGVAGGRRVTTGHGEVTLSVSECEIFSLLSSVDPNAAHWYIVDAISRAMGPRSTAARPAPRPSPSRLNPDATEFRCSSATQTDPPTPLAPARLAPPPGFER